MYILLVRFSGALPFRSGDLPSCKLIMPNTKSIHQTVHDIALRFFFPEFLFTQFSSFEASYQSELNRFANTLLFFDSEAERQQSIRMILNTGEKGQ